MRDAYKKTRKLYIRVFGSADNEIWGVGEPTCGDSCSGAIPGRKELQQDPNRVF